MKRILLVAPQVPWPPRQGTAIRNLNLALELAKRHRVTLAAFEERPSESSAAGATFDTAQAASSDIAVPDSDHAATSAVAIPDSDPPVTSAAQTSTPAPSASHDPLRAAGIALVSVPAPRPRTLVARLIDLPATATPDLARRLESEEFAAALDALADAAERDPDAAGFDVVQIEGLEMAPHGLAVHRRLSAAAERASRPAPRLIYDAHNAEWVLQDRAWRADLRRVIGWPGAAYSMIQTAKLRRFERALLAAASATVAVSEADAAALRPLAPGATIAVVPNGVDVDHYAPAGPAREEDGLCVFTGKMDFRPNVDATTWFCREVWPLVLARRPGARLEIVGRDPAPAVAALDEPGRGVAVVGAVPDVRPYVARAAIVVVPLRVGGGTRLKVLEAMAMGKAIAATSMAVEGLEVRDGREVRLADGPRAMAEAIAALIADPAQRAALGAAARARAESSYRWSALVPAIEALYG